MPRCPSAAPGRRARSSPLRTPAVPARPRPSAPSSRPPRPSAPATRARHRRRLPRPRSQRNALRSRCRYAAARPGAGRGAARLLQPAMPPQTPCSTARWGQRSDRLRCGATSGQTVRGRARPCTHRGPTSPCTPPEASAPPRHWADQLGLEERGPAATAPSGRRQRRSRRLPASTPSRLAYVAERPSGGRPQSARERTRMCPSAEARRRPPELGEAVRPQQHSPPQSPRAGSPGPRRPRRGTANASA
mmetsp:Transcript_97644/g.315262  ORF Transcript_97644/g.315262 Transcript_97644/m.315262 type:complete len:247 (-) Transcript_97644:151-891(-)